MDRIKKHLPLALICSLVVFLDAPVLNGEFLGWDDDKNILMNPFIINGDFWAIWGQSFYGLYVPLAYTVGISFSIWRAQSTAYITRSMSFSFMWPTFHFGLPLALDGQCRLAKREFGGCYSFALHPVQIESVAWISGMRDLLSSFFVLLAVLSNFSENKWMRFGVSPLLFGFALLCKPAVVAVPAGLWLVKVFRSPASAWKTTLEYAGWILLAVPIFFITRNTQVQFGIFEAELWQRPLIMVDALGFYVAKFFWPFPLSADYGRTPRWLVEHWDAVWPNALIAMGALVAALRSRSVWRYSLSGFVILILPVSGITTFAFQQISTVADRYCYLAFIPLMWGLSKGCAALFCNASALQKSAALWQPWCCFLFLIRVLGFGERMGIFLKLWRRRIREVIRRKLIWRVLISGKVI